MVKKKRDNILTTQQFLSPEQYLKQKARILEIGKCYMTDAIKKVGEGNQQGSMDHMPRWTLKGYSPSEL